MLGLDVPAADLDRVQLVPADAAEEDLLARPALVSKRHCFPSLTIGIGSGQSSSPTFSVACLVLRVHDDALSLAGLRGERRGVVLVLDRGPR